MKVIRMLLFFYLKQDIILKETNFLSSVCKMGRDDKKYSQIFIGKECDAVTFLLFEVLSSIMHTDLNKIILK
jgi:hypothetical protein